MSDFIKYEGRISRINLDLVTRYYTWDFSTSDEYPYAICFEYPSITDSNTHETLWYFESTEERDKLLAVIDKYKTTILQIEV